MDADLADLFVDGRRQPAHAADRLAVIDPASEQAFAEIPAGDVADVDRVVASARTALADAGWRGTSVGDRAAMLHRLADVLEKRSPEIIELSVRQNGIPVVSQPANVQAAVGTYRYYADLGATWEVEERRGSTLVCKEPIGVVGVIAPWNGPQALAAWKLAPAFLSGCTAVLKPAPETSLDAFLLADAALEAGIPPGVLNVVTGGSATGALLVDHPGVDKIGFTGSSAAGRLIAEKCGAALKPVTLELGGKSASIILDDADLDVFEATAVRVCIPNSGQVCTSNTRVLVPSRLHDDVVAALVSAFDRMVIGDPASAETTMGPVVAQRQLERIEGFVAAGRHEGARVARGGRRPADLDRGFFYEPTVFDHVSNEMTIAREEIFGPVVSVIEYADEEDAVALANASEYGLGGTVFSRDPDRAMVVARRVETGTVGINGYSIALDAPFGGVKSSGLGRELGPEGLQPYVQHKSVYYAP
jgi:acyl-CoA reductase-like NAD-dependent aldehyde dehydrogenase